MGFPLCSSSTEISFSCLETISQNKYLKSVIPKGFSRLGDLNWKDRHNGVLKKAFVSSHLVPGQLEGSYVGKKQLYEPSLKLEFVRTLLIDNYDSYTYNIYQELSVINGCKLIVESSYEDGKRGIDRRKPSFYETKLNFVCLKDLGITEQPFHRLPPVVIHNDEWSWEDVCHYLYEEKAFDNIVISPGPGSPTCPADVGICLRLLRECTDIPILGVCLGHQALGYVHGAQIIHAPEPIHGRLSDIEHNGCGLFHGIPSGRNSEFKDMQNGSVLMGIMHSSRPHYGLQFHPESIATCHGRQIFKNFAEITKDYWFRLRSSLDSKRKGHYSVTLSSELYLACMQVPNVTQLFQDVVRSNHLVNGFDNMKHGSLRNLVNPSHSRNAKFLKLKWRKVECSVSQVGGPENIFCELFGDHHAGNTCQQLLKSRARFSFMGGKGGSLWRQVTFRLSNKSCRDMASNHGGHLSIEDADGNITSTYLEDGFFDFLNQELQSFRYDVADYEGLPFDFYGGFIGYIGYDLKVECGAYANRHKSRAPDACLFFTDNLVVIDHHCDDIYVMSILDESTSTTPWIDDVEQKLLNMKLRPQGKSVSPAYKVSSKISPREGFTTEKSREQYITDIEKCQEFIKNGESYELCLTTQMNRSVGEIDSSDFILIFGKKNPAPDGILEAKPIKGTIARGASPEEDDLHKQRLQYSEKDQAENLMIVDLLRNDLGRVCEPGSVHVPRLMEIESYATVHTMVSTIRGKKRSNVSAVDCVRAAFPGGSMTGAPKLRSMEILDSLESSSRGIYSGCIGYFSYNQTFDLNIVIRTIVIHDGVASIGAGGAITALSNSNDEYEEMVLKTRAPSKAVLECVVQTDDNSQVDF
ncbi:hypothetical protein DH2020_028301 [Rehmannia glutinosa]|uniref:aminodeoxychorismate synthase n=1 Tax=Rehmannia glutinosa TaxID=99300 RepID=A0ABR0VTI4_REHGL